VQFHHADLIYSFRQKRGVKWSRLPPSHQAAVADSEVLDVGEVEHRRRKARTRGKCGKNENYMVRSSLSLMHIFVSFVHHLWGTVKWSWETRETLFPQIFCQSLWTSKNRK